METQNKATWTDADGKSHVVLPLGKINWNGSPRVTALSMHIIKRDGYVCQSCGFVGKRLHFTERLEFDHIIPRRDGGTNHPDNLQLLCPKCNQTKRRWERLWRENLKMGTPNDYADWERRYVPASYLHTVFKPDAIAEWGHGGVM